jgi:peptidylprolyl isomerase
MAQAQKGDKVKVHYTGRLDDGNVFDSSLEREPLEFQVGGGEVIPGFEDAVVGMAPGESKTINIESKEAYGGHREELVQKFPRQQFPDDVDPEVGQKLQINQPDKPPLVVEVTEVTDSFVTLDANHPLAGEDLTFEIQLVEIV